MPCRRRLIVRRVAFASIVAAGAFVGAARADQAPASGVIALAQVTTSPARSSATTANRRAAGNSIRRARTPQRDSRRQCLARGEARWYGPGFNGNRTASGEVFDMNRLTAASRSVPMGAWVRVTRLDNGRSVIVKVNDRHGERPGMVIDLSRAAAQQIGMLGSGVARVCVTQAERPRPAASARGAQQPQARSRSAASGARRR